MQTNPSDDATDGQEPEKEPISFVGKMKKELSRFKLLGLTGNNLTANQQKKRVLIGVSILIFALLIIVQMRNQHQRNVSQKSENRPQEITKFTTPTNRIDHRAIWMQKAEKQLKEEERQGQELKSLLAKQASEINREKLQRKSQSEEIAELRKALIDLKREIKEKPQSGRFVVPSAEQADHSTYSNDQQAGDSASWLIREDQLNLESPLLNKEGVSRIKTVDNYVPAGTFVKALVLQGVDAAAGVVSQSDPRPILLRLIDQGVLPGGKESHLKECIVVGASYGDLSSERVYVRLERLSCEQLDKFIDIPVYGYIAGTDGKVGQRGSVAFRDKAFIQRAFTGGLFSGLGQSLSDSFTTQSVSALGSTTHVPASRIFEYGGVKGVSNALDMYAQYNIKRAEQYQPVVQMSPGQIVNIVFHKGFWLEEGSADSQDSPNRHSGEFTTS